MRSERDWSVSFYCHAGLQSVRKNLRIVGNIPQGKKGEGTLVVWLMAMNSFSEEGEEIDHSFLNI